SPELNPIEQFWSVVKSKVKRHKLLETETLTKCYLECLSLSWSCLSAWAPNLLKSSLSSNHQRLPPICEIVHEKPHLRVISHYYSQSHNDTIVKQQGCTASLAEYGCQLYA
ncbi:hypothetical protein DM01DRAFT_1399007, partial [Hesseltinella vesiculosa]